MSCSFYKLHDLLRMVLLSVTFDTGKGDAMIDKYPAAENNLF